MAQRFKVEVHDEQKEFRVYALVVGKNGPKLKESAEHTGTPGGSFGMSSTGRGEGGWSPGTPI